MNPTDHSGTCNENLHAEKNRQWLKWLFSRNPFYILSAGLLLYAIYRLSIDPRMFATELGQLLFNFGSFQVYELLLVGTAIFLVRRQIWYDSALLIGLETLFVLVPFILISQALLIEGDVAAVFCLGATALAVTRFAAVKKYFARVNLPPRLLLLGGVLLIVNLGLPLLVRLLHRDMNIAVWELRGGGFYDKAWLIAMPLLLGLGNLLSAPKERGDLLVEKSYFPLTIFSLWVIVTGAHLYSVGYVYGLNWTMAFLVPMLWVAVWTLRHRLGDFNLCDRELQVVARDLLLIPAAVVPVIAAVNGAWTLFLVIVALNLAAYAFLTVRDRNRLAFQLLLASGAMVLAGLPKPAIEWAVPEISRGSMVAYAIGGYILLCALLSRSPKLGIVGGAVAGIGTAIFFNETNYFMHVGAQVGLVFLLVHSLRWVDVDEVGAAAARNIGAGLWALHSMLWIAGGGSTAWAATGSFALVTIVVYFAVRLIFGFWGPRVVPYAAMMVLVCKPALLAHEYVKEAPAGVLALVASFALFAIGTLAALMRNRGNNNERTLVPNTQMNTTL